MPSDPRAVDYGSGRADVVKKLNRRLDELEKSLDESKERLTELEKKWMEPIQGSNELEERVAELEKVLEPPADTPIDVKKSD